jgi:hemoglobin-like flavoprotein
MTPEQKRLVRHTWSQVAPSADAAADMFYRRLFEIDPATRKLFRATEMVAQRKKLLQTLSFAINGLDDLERLVSKVEDLGRRHAGYGVTDAHYDSVGAALLWTLEQGLGRAWTPAVASAWIEVYGMLSGIMRDAAARVDVASAKRVAARLSGPI